MPQKITERIRQKMFDLWCMKPSDRFVARKCGVSEVTVKRYRRKDKWKERLVKIRQRVQKAQDSDEVERRKRQIRDAKVAQQAGLKTLLDENGKVKALKSEAAALTAIFQGAKAEREAAGVTTKVDVRVGRYDDWTEDQLRARLVELKAEG